MTLLSYSADWLVDCPDYSSARRKLHAAWLSMKLPLATETLLSTSFPEKVLLKFLETTGLNKKM